MHVSFLQQPGGVRMGGVCSWRVERLVALGAERVEDWPYPPKADFIVLRDPDGNEFCVIDHEDLIAST
jgi:glyoxalase superfamily protein